MSDHKDFESSDAPEGVAIIGMACRFPGARTVEGFWRNLRDGMESITRFSEAELAAEGVPRAHLQAPSYVKAAPVLDDVASFDAALFDILPREAELMDPQHRLLLECAFEAFEAAGHDPARSTERIGVFAGAALNTYAAHVFANTELLRTTDPLLVQTAVDKDYIATLISYRLGLRGPSIGVQTACSTSLVAVHLACQSLMTYQCDLVLAGGSSVRVPQKRGYFHVSGGVASLDGHCRAFDANASGTLFGSGVGAVVLKRLTDAIADGDCIHAVILGSAINNDGARKVGFTAPSVQGQAEVIATAQAMAEVSPETIGYIETHGTGTVLGDPIEVAALQEAFRIRTRKRGFCALGSVKSNLGHLDVAAGMAGLIKTVLALENRQIPPTLHFERPNPAIDFDGSPFFVNTRLREWPADGGPRRAGVSSFGIGGTNAHLVLEEAPAPGPSDPSRAWQLLLLSARTESALELVTDNLARHLRETPGLDLADAAHTLQIGRRAFEHRRVLVCDSVGDAAAALEERHPKRVLSDFQEPRDRPVAFLFPGGGAQYADMGLELYRVEPVFRQEMDRCLELFAGLGLDLVPHLYPALRGEGIAASLSRTSTALPALFATEVALAKLWMSWGVRPQALIGHSLGEYAAAHLAGILSLEDAVALVALRGRLFEKLPQGVMLSVPLPESEVLSWLGERLSIAAINDPTQCVVSGPVEAIDELEGRLAARGLEVLRLHIEVAAHSHLVEPILEEFGAFVRGIRLQAPRLPVLSNVTGTWLTPAEATDPGYWVRQLRQTVRFADGVERLLEEPNRILLEVGPGRTLTTIARRHPRWSADRVTLASLRHPQDVQTDLAFLLDALGRLWLAGLEIDWKGFSGNEKRHRVRLPLSPMERQRYWLEMPAEGFGAGQGWSVGERSRKREPADWFFLPAWRQSMPPLAPASPQVESGRWLVFADGCGLGERLAGRLRRQGADVVVVVPGQRFEKVEGRGYSLRPGQRQDFDALIASLRTDDRMPDRIVHLWSCDPRGDEGGVEEILARGFSSLVSLVQAWGEAGVRRDLRLAIVASSLWRVAGDDLPVPEKATVLGPARVIPREYPQISCRALDVVLPKGDFLRDRLADQILAELLSDRAESAVAYRHDQRWVLELEPLSLERREDPGPRLRPGGVYLLTGGLGGIGLTIAEHLARSVRAKLVLMGRSGLPERAHWSAWAARGDEAMARRIRKVLALEAAGSEVLVVQADVTDPSQVAWAVAQTIGRFGTLNGVLHGAGIPAGGLIQLKTPEAVEAVMAPKIRGTRALAAAVAGLPLDFFVLHSSTLGLTGDVGQVDYCAANAFLDAFAHAHGLLTGQPTISIDWSVWSDVGMAFDVARGAAVPPGPAAGGEASGPPAHPLLGRRLEAPDGEIRYQAELGPATQWLLAEHRILGEPVMPGVAYLEMARAAFSLHTGSSAVCLRDVVFVQPLHVAESQTKEVRTALRGDGDGFSFTISSRTRGAAWMEHASGRLAPLEEPAGRHAMPSELPAWAGTDSVEQADTEGPVTWGPRWHEIHKRPFGPGLALLELPADRKVEAQAFGLYPPLLDLATACGVVELSDGPFLPLAYEAVRIWRDLGDKVWVRFERRDGARGSTVSFDVTLADPEGREVMRVERFTLKRVDESLLAGARPGPRESPASSPQGSALLAEGITEAMGGDLFGRILAQVNFPQIAVSARDLPAEFARLRSDAPRQEASADSTSAPAPTSSKYPRPRLPNPCVAPRTEIERSMAALWEQTLGFEGIGVYDDFFALGGHSVMAIQLLASVRETFAVDLPLDALFEAATITDLAEAVLRALSEGTDETELREALAELAIAGGEQLLMEGNGSDV